jgi:hypothetical protein
VKWFAPSNRLGVLNFAVKLLLTLATIVGMVMALNLVRNAHKLFLDSQAGLKTPPPIYVGKPVANNQSDPSVQPFWPEYPHNDAGAFQSAVINGVQVLTEEWTCNASPGELLAYYRDQMAARGWRDVTDKVRFELSGTPNVTEDEQAISNYRNFLATTLTVERGDWSLQVSVKPGNRDGQIAVKICAAETLSSAAFFLQMGASLQKDQGPDVKPVDVVQDNGSEHYHTTITASTKPPETAFQETLAKLAAQGWRPAMFLPKAKTSSGYLAWLVRGKQYASLSVNPLPQNKLCSITLTEVTPH